MEPLVTAIIPVYNDARFVRDAINSVLHQTYTPLECLVVNDGSDDDTSEVLRDFSNLIQIINQENRGVAAARNAGIEAARGDLVAFLDSDDVWLPDKIQNQMELIARFPNLALVYTGLHLVDEHLRFVGRIDPPRADQALWNTLVLERPVISLSQTGLTPRKLLTRLGGFDERLSTSADCDMACRLALSGPIAPVPQPLTLYRIHDGQMHRNPQATLDDMNLVFDKLFQDPSMPISIKNARRRAEANLHVAVAGAYLKHGVRGSFLRHLGQALLRSPRRVMAAVKRLTEPPGWGS
jgi:glycosyltransferase involved in cell wall biosynthesis